MSRLSGNKVLFSIVVILLLANIFMVVALLKKNKDCPPQEKRRSLTERLKTDVGFTPEQMEVFEQRKTVFWTEMRKRMDSIRNIKQNFYAQLYDPSVPDSVILSKAEVIGQQQKDLDIFVIRHFKGVRAICTPDQLPLYDSLLPPIVERMTSGSRKR